MRKARFLGIVLAALVLLMPVAGAQGNIAGFPIQRDPSIYYSPSGFMDMQGNLILPAEYSAITDLSLPEDTVKRLSAGKVFHAEATENSTYIDRRTALFSPDGKQLSEFLYGYITRLDDGLYAGYIYEEVYAQSKADILNEKGEVVHRMGVDDHLFRNTKGYLHIDNTEGKWRVLQLDDGFKTLSTTDLSAEAAFSYMNSANSSVQMNPTAVMLAEKGQKVTAAYDMDLNLLFTGDYIDIYQLTDNLFSASKDMLNYALLSRDGKALTDFAFMYMHTNYMAGSFIEASMTNEVVLLSPDGKLLTQPGEFRFFDTYASPDIAVGFRNEGDGEPVLILSDGSRIEDLGVSNYAITPLGENRVILTPNSESGSAAVILLKTDTGDRIELETVDMDYTSCYAFDVGGGSFVVAYQREMNPEDYRMVSLSRLYGSDGKPLTEQLSNAFAAYGNDDLILAQRGTGNLLLWGALDSNGNEVLPFRYKKLQITAPGVFLAQEGGQIGYIDLQGNWIHKQSAYLDLSD